MTVQNRFFRWTKPAVILTNTKSWQIGDKLEKVIKIPIFTIALLFIGRIMRCRNFLSSQIPQYILYLQ